MRELIWPALRAEMDRRGVDLRPAARGAGAAGTGQVPGSRRGRLGTAPARVRTRSPDRARASARARPKSPNQPRMSTARSLSA